MTCLDERFRPEAETDWLGIINPANEGAEAWVARVGGLYIASLALSKNAAVAYPTDQFVSPRYEVYEGREVAGTLLAKATEFLLIKEGIVVLPQMPEVLDRLEVPQLAPVVPLRGLQPQA